MTLQRLHSQMAPIDLLTREELDQSLHRGLDAAMRERVRGLDLARIPYYPVLAAGATVNIFSPNDATPFGPEQGDIWMVRRVIVKSSNLSDTAKYVVYRGSTPSDQQNAYTSRWLLDGFIGASAAVTQPSPSTPNSGNVLASGVAQQNVNSYAVQVVISANGATISNVVVNGISVGTSAGTYIVPAYGAISVTYTVATPTWVWSNPASNIPAGTPGFTVNTGYYPGTKAVFLYPGEQIYAQVLTATTGNQYAIDGEAIRVPAEMRGKIL
jgi:hypothetical protein